MKFNSKSSIHVVNYIFTIPCSDLIYYRWLNTAYIRCNTTYCVTGYKQLMLSRSTVSPTHVSTCLISFLSHSDLFCVTTRGASFRFLQHSIIKYIYFLLNICLMSSVGTNLSMLKDGFHSQYCTTHLPMQFKQVLTTILHNTHANASKC